MSFAAPDDRAVEQDLKGEGLVVVGAGLLRHAVDLLGILALKLVDLFQDLLQCLEIGSEESGGDHHLRDIGIPLGGHILGGLQENLGIVDKTSHVTLEILACLPRVVIGDIHHHGIKAGSSQPIQVLLGHHGVDLIVGAQKRSSRTENAALRHQTGGLLIQRIPTVIGSAVDRRTVIHVVPSQHIRLPNDLSGGLIAVAMSRAVDRVAGTHSQIKWTNDLILNGRKLCGILTELSVEGETGELQYVVAGIGFNVSQREEDFVGEVSKIATSILRETGRLISRAELSAAMIEELDALYTALRSGETSGYLDEYRHRCVTIGREVQLLWQDTKEKVTALDVDEEFGLIVRRENGTVETVRTGEVSVRGLYGYVE